MVVIRRTDSCLESESGMQKMIESIKIDFKSVKQETPTLPVSIETLIQTKNNESEKLLSIDPDIMELVYNLLSNEQDSLESGLTEIQAEHLKEFIDQFENYL